MPNVIIKQRYYGKEHSRRMFYSSGQSEDYLRYVDKGGKAGIKYSDYIDYAGSTEKSVGIFDKNGLLTEEQKKALRTQLRNTESVIWDMVISFEKDFGKCHVKDADDARNLLNATLNRFFRRAGLKSNNISWHAGLHTNTDNPHIHVSYFENQPLRFHQNDREGKYFHDGNINRRAFDDMKMSVETYFSDTATKVKESRKQLLAVADKAIRKDANYDRKLAALYVQLYELIPSQGHIGYDSQNMCGVKAKADEITSLLLSQNSYVKPEYERFKHALQARDDEVREFVRKNKIKDVTPYLTTDKTIDDLYRRLGNKVIRQALNLKRERRAAMQKAKRKRYENKSLSFLISETAYLNAMVEREAIDAFQEFLEKLEEAEFENLQEVNEM